MSVFSILSLVVAILYAGSVICDYNESIPPLRISEGKSIKWHYVPEFLLPHSRGMAARVLPIQCQSGTLCGVKRNVDPTTTAISSITQYCECPENEECRRIAVIDPSNFTYYRCMDKF